MDDRVFAQWRVLAKSAILLLFAAMLLWLLANNQAVADEPEFPYREQYAAVGVQTIERAELIANLDDYVIVDVRERFEYDTIHIKGAYSVPFSHRDFSQEIHALAREHGKPIVFYCNGRACSVSYRAAAYGLESGIAEVQVYDLGILPWAKMHPEETILFGQPMLEHPDGLISDAQFRERTLTQQRFFGLIQQKAAPIVLDVRSDAQRDGVSLYFGDRHLPLDNSDQQIMAVVDEAIAENRTVFVMDDAGHQIRWLQHAFEERGLNDYWFLDGGAVVIYESMQQPASL